GIENLRSNQMNTNYKRLTRSRTNRMIAGLCAGLGEYMGMDPTIVRLLFILAFFLGLHFGVVLIYLIMALIVPEEPVKQVQ
ncbi:MAG TPA: PspC domain-containing protein, partial [Anaerolineales bacterium]|nr:PspC domain-containing protein [Anaerolineales bacterium]